MNHDRAMTFYPDSRGPINLSLSATKRPCVLRDLSLWGGLTRSVESPGLIHLSEDGTPVSTRGGN